MAYGRAGRSEAHASENRTIVGAETPAQSQSAQASSSGGGWKFALGAAIFIGVGYIVTKPIAKDLARLNARTNERMREVGIKKGMTESEKNRLWDAYYAKQGLRLKNGELVKISKES